MKQLYIRKKFSPEREALIADIDAMCRSYQAQGFMLSVRQLYYQLVARAKIPNTERSYKNTASLINDARLAGLLDWDAIEDRGRDIEMKYRWKSGSQIIRSAADNFHQDLWINQGNRVIVIVEKAALAGVLDSVCKEHDVPLLAARGYPSVSIVRELALAHIKPALKAGQDVTVLHFGDHDPSGIDMTRDLDERLDLFAPSNGKSFCVIERIALTMEQIDDYEPPPNPAKITDSRFAGYADQYGDESWELDALEPSVLVQLVEDHVAKYKDEDLWDERVAEVEEIRERLTAVADQFDEDNL